MQKGFAHLPLLVALPILIFFGMWVYQYNFLNVRQINTFFDCQDAGYLDPRSDPPVCITPNGSYSWVEAANPSPITFIEQPSYETTNWKTYTNKKIGFSIMYPPSTDMPSIIQGPEGQVMESSDINGSEENVAILFPGNNHDYSDSYTLDIFPYNGSLENISQGIKRSLSGKTYRDKLVKNVLIDEQQTLWFKSADIAANYEVHFTKNGYGFGLYGSTTMDEKMMEKVAETFKFLK